MEIDLAQLESSASGSDLLRAEICIVGAGIAGLTLAQALVRRGHDVLLLEAGSSAAHEASQAEEVAQAGHPHPGTMERRGNAFGGTSLLWGGQLLPLPADAEWPVTADEFSPYALEAGRLLGVDDLPYDAQGFFRERKELAPVFFDALPDVNFLLSKFAPFSHRNFARTIGTKLRKRSNIRVAVHARAVELLLSSAVDRIEAVIVRSSTGHIYRVDAKQIVVAAGTIETVRLLLASRSVAAKGVGNENDQVGRNFHDHLTVTAATLHGGARRQLLNLRPWIYGGTLHAFKFSAGAELRNRLSLNPVVAHLVIEEPIDTGVGAIRSLLRARQQGRLSEAGWSALPAVPSALRDAALLAFSARAQHRRYVSPRAEVQLRLNVAQQSPSASRIALRPDGRAVLDWKIDESELATLRTFADYLRGRLLTEGIEWNPSLLGSASSAPIPDLDDARHAMGGACMGIDSRSSVVDRDLRVHGLSNLFLASAAVFPDGSPQLPTLPLMALTLRLADYLTRQI